MKKITTLKTLLASASEIAASQLKPGQSLPKIIDVTAESLANAIINTAESVELDEPGPEGFVVLNGNGAKSLMVHALARLLTASAT